MTQYSPIFTLSNSPVITFSDDVDRDSISNVLNLFAGRRVLVTCSDDSQTTGEIRLVDRDHMHIQCFNDDDEPTVRVFVSIDLIEEVTYL